MRIKEDTHDFRALRPAVSHTMNGCDEGRRARMFVNGPQPVSGCRPQHSRCIEGQVHNGAHHVC